MSHDSHNYCLTPKQRNSNLIVHDIVICNRGTITAMVYIRTLIILNKQVNIIAKLAANAFPLDLSTLMVYTHHVIIMTEGCFLNAAVHRPILKLPMVVQCKFNTSIMNTTFVITDSTQRDSSYMHYGRMHMGLSYTCPAVHHAVHYTTYTQLCLSRLHPCAVLPVVHSATIYGNCIAIYSVVW